MSGGITVKEFKHIPGVNDAEYIKKLEELNEINKRIISKAVTKIKMLSAQPERKTGHWIAITSWNNTYKCSVCGRLLVNITDGKNKVAKNYPYCHCGADMRGDKHEAD